jgi:hypothetical protein
MVNELLVNLTNSVLGVGKRTSRGNLAYHCPFCNHHKPKLEINFTENKKGLNPWHCWVCNAQGKTLYSLFKKSEVSPEILSQVKPLIKTGEEVEETRSDFQVQLPKEFKLLINAPKNDIIARHAMTYLKNRNINIDDIIKYNIGYCDGGPYSNMILIPSYDSQGNLNYFTARSFEKNPYVKYRNPEVSRDIVPNEHLINWNLPIILCEGMFDAITIKRNAIPLLGKNIQSNLMKKIVTSAVKKIYISLDRDAMKQALQFSQRFMNEGKEVYLVELDGKDPSEMGFAHFTDLIKNTLPLTEYGLMEKKLTLL